MHTSFGVWVGGERATCVFGWGILYRPRRFEWM